MCFLLLPVPPSVRIESSATSISQVASAAEEGLSVSLYCNSSGGNRPAESDSSRSVGWCFKGRRSAACSCCEPVGTLSADHRNLSMKVTPLQTGEYICVDRTTQFNWKTDSAPHRLEVLRTFLILIDKFIDKNDQFSIILLLNIQFSC